MFRSNRELFMFPYPNKELTLPDVIFTILVQIGIACMFPFFLIDFYYN